MKIITNNGIYVQKKDIAYFSGLDLDVPPSILVKTYGALGPKFGFNVIQKHEFIKFNKQEEIDFLNNLNFSINYNEMENIPEKKIIRNINKLSLKIKIIKEKLNSMSDKQRKENIELYKKFYLLNFLVSDFEDFLIVKKHGLPSNIKFSISLNNIENNCKKLLKSINNRKI